MHFIHFSRRASRLLFSSALGASLCAPAWAQDAPTAPVPVPGASDAAAAAGVSGSGATTGAGSAPQTATTLMQATDTPRTQQGKRRSRRLKNGLARPGTIEPWAGRRVLLLLPLQLGQNFNADRAFGAAILGNAEATLQQELEATGKFSVIRAHRFSPLIQRALQEKRLTPEQANDAIANKLPTSPGQNPTREPVTVAAATTFLQQFAFDQVPLIGEFFLEEVGAGTQNNRASVQSQVAARLYELNNPVALKSITLRSDEAIIGRNNIERYLEATRDAFRSTADELTAPLEDVDLPAIAASSSEPQTAPAPDAATGTGPAPATSPAPAIQPAPATEPAPAPATSPAPAPVPGVAPGTEPA